MITVMEPAKRVTLTQLYSSRAQVYQNMAALETADATRKDKEATTSQTAADYFRDKAQEYEQNAQAEYQAAGQYTKLLKGVTDKLTDYQGAMDEIQRTLDQSGKTNGTVLLWAATSQDAAGRIQGEMSGNGLITRHEYDPYSGQLKRIVTGIENGREVVRDLRYTYDAADNVATRQDVVQGYHDSYSYDTFDRLKTALRSTMVSSTKFNLSFEYDTNGNMNYKSDAGRMGYDTSKNRLTTLTKNNGTIQSYSYDANGNMAQSADRQIKWTSFNQPLTIQRNTTTATFYYDGNQQRIKQANGTNGQSEITTYVSKAYEVTRTTKNLKLKEEYQHHIYAGGEVVATHISTKDEGKDLPSQIRYLHKDALGNVDTITDGHGQVVQRVAFKPFGERTVTFSTEGSSAWSKRGFTGHEHLEDLGLIHMNARLYDPEVGRFISADSMIPSPELSQGYNRYAYVMNNPLKYSDPSGHFPMLFALFFVFAAAVTDIPILDTIATIAFAAALGPGATLLGSMITGAAAGFVGGLVSGQNPFKAAAWGALSGMFAGVIGHGGLNGGPLFGGWVATNLAHGISQGIVAELRGGEFKSGFVGAVVGGLAGRASQAVTAGIRGFNAGLVMARTAAAAVFGGLAAQATGGSFADGAVSAAFVHLFNHEKAPICQYESQNYCTVPDGFVNYNTYGNRAGFTSSLTYGASEKYAAYYGTDEAKANVEKGAALAVVGAATGAVVVTAVSAYGAVTYFSTTNFVLTNSYRINATAIAVAEFEVGYRGPEPPMSTASKWEVWGYVSGKVRGLFE